MTTLTRLTMIVEDHEQDLLSAMLALAVPHGWEENPMPDGKRGATAHFVLASAADETAARFTAFFPEGTLLRDEVVQENWAEAWKEFFTPVEGGTHFLVLAPWMEKERAETTRQPIIIEPKTAFGTGHHGTTALCLDAISACAPRFRPASRFLDLGTGSGILGIACALLGLTGDGYDIDPVAVENALENRELNRVAPEAFAVAEGGVEAPEGPYDLVVANILAAPLKEMAAPLSALVRKDAAGKYTGILVLSGMLDHQTGAVEEEYRKCGFPPAEKRVRGEWAALVFMP